MIRFAWRTFAVLDRPARVRFLLFGLGSVAVAALEAVGVALVVPLTELLLDEDARATGVARFISDTLELDSSRQVAAALAVGVLLAFMVKATGAMLLLRWGIGNSLKQEARIARRLFSGYLTAPISFHLKHNSAEVQRTLNESLLTVFRRALPFVLAAAADAFTLLAVISVILLSDLAIALIAVAYFSVVAVVYQRFIGGRQKVAARQAHEEVATRYRQVQEALRAAKELAVLHREDHFISRFYATKLELARAQRQLVLYQLLPRQFLDLAFVLGAALMAGFAFATRSTEAALASVGLFLTASFRMVAPLNRVMSGYTIARTADPALDQVVHDLALLDAEQRARPVVPVGPVPPGPLELVDVSFRYLDSLPDVLVGLSLRIDPGDDVAIVGSTGAGKTTLLDVLLGLHDPQAGEVLIGGAPLTAHRTGWQLSIGYVPQHIVLIDDTVRANVAFGIDAAELDDERVWDALRIAQIDGFVASLPDGLDAVVGEHGVRLSGGQRQRLGIARALYHRPRVLVLDEATSSLDSRTEAGIMETIATLRGRLTIVTVSHRLSTLKHCDRIYFLRHGRIAAVGGFDELRRRDAEFAHLVALAELTPSGDAEPADDGTRLTPERESAAAPAGAAGTPRPARRRTQQLRAHPREP
ncbi:MAG: ABC transporter ATP-binding protein [Acidimicrobiales bacterium]